MRTLFIFSGLLFCFARVAAQKADTLFVVDSISMAFKKPLPFNVPVTLVIPIQAKEVTSIDLVPKYKYHDLSETIGHYIKVHKGSYIVPTIPKQYYTVKGSNGRDTLIIRFRDQYLLSPSTAYFLIITQKKLSAPARHFFDAYNDYKLSGDRSDLANAEKKLNAFNSLMLQTFGSDNLTYGWYSPDDFRKHPEFFDADFRSHIAPAYRSLQTHKSNFEAFAAYRATEIKNNYPELDSLLSLLIHADSTVNNNAVGYMQGANLTTADLVAELYLLRRNGDIAPVLYGLSGIGCTTCAKTATDNYPARLANIKSSITNLNLLARRLVLLSARYPRDRTIDNGSRNIANWTNILQNCSDSIAGMNKLCKAIDDKILETEFLTLAATDTTPAQFANFQYSSVASGNSYLDFATRNQLLLAPDFGLVTSSITAAGKNIDYAIVPYLGFHINFMPVDKDIAFKSYRKNWKQFFSIMVGWSLVNVARDSSTYSNFFAKSSLLTGVGYRLSNAVRITAGTQWMFKGAKTADSPTKRKPLALPFVGLSFDLNIKQYVNGLVDILSGISTTKATTNNPSNQ
jgi:hypothetical protein